MMERLINKRNRQGGRFFFKGLFLASLLFLGTDDDSLFGSTAKEAKNVPQSVTKNAGRSELFVAPEDTKNNIKTESWNSGKTMGGSPSIYATNLLIKSKVKNLLEERKIFYEERRTLTPSEISNLHSVKDSENYPFAVRNEALLILRELAIEHRIPQECVEEVSAECLVVLERSQAGSMPLECENPNNDEQCNKAFAGFWES